MRVKGQSYASLLEYYRAVNPQLAVEGDAPVVKVSFPGLGRPQPVAAERVRARVMNDDVPDPLGSVAKIAPAERREAIRRFWEGLSPRPFGRIAPGLQDGFWRPDAARVVQVPPAELLFGQGGRLAPPAAHSADAYRAHYRQRQERLDRSGCYGVPPAMPRTLHFAYPRRLGEAAARQLATDVAAAISGWTGLAVDAAPMPYESIADAVDRLRATGRDGVTLFMLNEEPTAYHEAAYGLPGWRLKRVTEWALGQHHDVLLRGAKDRRTGLLNKARGQARWKGFVTLNALDVLQLLDVVPYRVAAPGPYEAQVAIDVGHDQRHVALSLLLARDEGSSPAFRIVSHVEPKTDHQHEAINPVVLEDQLVRLVEDALPTGADPLASLVVFRDGKLSEPEIAGIDRAMARLAASGCLGTDARIDPGELHKGTLKSLRLWDVDSADVASNPLEGSLVRLDDSTVLVAATGVATLTQGTAAPWLVVARRCASATDAAVAALTSCQLNWSSPGVAQRLPLELKRTDDELTARAAQEIRRLR